MTATALLLVLLLSGYYWHVRRAASIRLQRMRAEADHKLQLMYADSLKGYYGYEFQVAENPLHCVWENGEWKQIT